ncbi:SRPBCC family protein [Halioglobus maricola]|uniref:SRPBCC family protein n=1 Tax=Halioglobus maricola TaxID=2601894 RepID=A0A5P9NMR2_9GAMM|nr:SRPBCC family protein [Halioglobus maricola]QFU76796.1 SRPBCC family protein [Halioglobus maricola]
MRSSWFKQALLALIFLISPGAFAEVVAVGDSGFHIRVQVDLPVSKDAAWEQFIHPERWWSEGHTWFGSRKNFSLDPVAGGCFCEILGDKSVLHLTVSTVVPGEKIIMLGGLGPLQALGLSGPAVFTFADLGDGRTRVVHDYRVTGFTQMNLEELAPIVAGVQQEQLDSLAASLEVQD